MTSQTPQQTALFPEPPELGKKIVVLDYLADFRAAKIEQARTKARELVYRNVFMARIGIPYLVWADLVREALHLFTRPKYNKNLISLNYMGCVFRTDDFIYIRKIASKTYNSHGNDINAYTLPEYEKTVREAIATNAI